MLSLSILTVLENHFFCTTDCRFCFDRNLAPKQGGGTFYNQNYSQITTATPPHIRELSPSLLVLDNETTREGGLLILRFL
jgi:hypothetical protein